VPQAAPAPSRLGEQKHPDPAAVTGVKDKKVTTPLLVAPSAAGKSDCGDGPDASWCRALLENRK
jgi:hypothetical protein